MSSSSFCSSPLCSPFPFPTFKRSNLSSLHLPTVSPAPNPKIHTSISQHPHKSNRNVTTRAHFNISSAPLISPQDHWGMWTSLFSIAAFGIWSERTAIGSMLSAAIVSILAGLAASNLGILPFEAPAYSVVMDFLLPVAVPLLLFRADLRRIFRSTGTLLVVFLLGSVATTIGTAVAYLLVPMRSLGQDSWKIAAALMSSYIGGAVNYVAVSEALGVSPSVMAAGIAVDNVICAIYFTTLFALASKIPPEASLSSTGTDPDPKDDAIVEAPVAGDYGWGPADPAVELDIGVPAQGGLSASIFGV
eukprot:TRINITY_DN41600_c0_g1_i4.p1 TRINITY_DN41600_c0_g1~~TRINITY_DN41600_c0_g1_i4.p1  ORF type:complete len:304 (-),score=39.15 TRINITY_DN41600_c0_g1_i4:1783-2694(-)